MFHQFWHVKHPTASSVFELKAVGKPMNKCIKRYIYYYHTLCVIVNGY